MLLILGCLYPIPLHQDRQYHRTKTGFDTANRPWPQPAPLSYPARIEEEPSITTNSSYRFCEAYKLQRNQGPWMLIRADMQAWPWRVARRYYVESASCRRATFEEQ